MILRIDTKQEKTRGGKTINLVGPFFLEQLLDSTDNNNENFTIRVPENT